MTEKDQVIQCRGIGEKNAGLLSKLCLYTIEDLLHYYPSHYDRMERICSINQGVHGQKVALKLRLLSEPKKEFSGKIPRVKVIAGDGEEKINIVWFRQTYLTNVLKKGREYVFRGKLQRNPFGLILEQPAIYSPEEYEPISGRWQPIYSLTAGLKPKVIEKAMADIFLRMTFSPDYLPENIRKRYSLMGEKQALENIHFPGEELLRQEARRRLVFDEFFFFLLAIRQQKEKRGEGKNLFSMTPGSYADYIVKSLPYDLTNAQKRTLKEIRRDLSGEHPMNRLIQGDVGSGKTILALLALVDVAEAGYQGALMAPTDVLARQHAENFKQLFEEMEIPFHVELLTGTMSPKEKREAQERISSGRVDIVIGTHALISEKVQYANLALVITDEQHRFGVRQREALSMKGKNPHILVMSATPIPRTLAVVLYGDLDISLVDEVPVGRIPIKNCVINESQRVYAYRFIGKELAKGRQAYIVCPMVEDSEGMDGENVVDYVKKLQEIFPPNIKIDYLHGKMTATEKNHRMEEFAKGEIRILVSTTVIEVGIHVANATVMLIENAERFGLAQLHQLRGRVGRGKEKSYCVFVNTGGGEARERLKILENSHDGFFIASEDLRLRGPGELLGLRQNGYLNFKLGDIVADQKTLQDAWQTVNEIFDETPELLTDEDSPLKERWEAYQKKGPYRLAI